MGGGSSKPVPGVELVRRLDEVGLCADAEFWQGRRVKGGEDLLVRRTEKQKMGPDESALIDREVSTLRRLQVGSAKLAPPLASRVPAFKQCAAGLLE